MKNHNKFVDLVETTLNESVIDIGDELRSEAENYEQLPTQEIQPIEPQTVDQVEQPQDQPEEKQTIENMVIPFVDFHKYQVLKHLIDSYGQDELGENIINEFNEIEEKLKTLQENPKLYEEFLKMEFDCYKTCVNSFLDGSKFKDGETCLGSYVSGVTVNDGKLSKKDEIIQTVKEVIVKSDEEQYDEDDDMDIEVDEDGDVMEESFKITDSRLKRLLF